MFWAIIVLPRPLVPTRIRLRASGESPSNDVAFDLGGPGPVEVGHGFELLDLGKAQPPFQTAVGAFGGLGLRQMFQNLARRPALSGFLPGAPVPARRRGPAPHRSQPAPPSTRRSTSLRCAPSAIRTPISAVRRDT